MKRLYRYRQSFVWCVCALLCVCCTACSSDQTIHDVDDHQNDVPMQFSQAAISTPVTRATSTALSQGFLVSCWKGVGTSKQQEVMGAYEVKYSHDSWNNVSTWRYVGSTTDGFYKDQLQRYWDAEAFPYQFYAVTPCPAHADIPQYELTNTRFAMPESVAFAYQTCNNGVVTGGAEPCYVAQVEYNQVSSYVALPFRHLTSKVRFLIYNNYKKDIPSDFKLSNICIKVASDDFVIAGKGYTADMTAADMLHGTFNETTKATDAEKVLLQTDDDDARRCDLKTAVDRNHAYDCMNPDGLLQMPQKNIRLASSPQGVYSER